jgi:hypothetical protein
MTTILVNAKIDIGDESRDVRGRFECALAFAGFQKTRVAANDETFELPENEYIVGHRGTTDDIALRIFAAADAANVSRIACVLCVENAPSRNR